MTNRPRGTVIVACSAAVLLLFSKSAFPGEFQIDRQGKSLIVTGEVSSDAHVAALRRVINEDFSDITVDIELTPAVELPAGWSLVIEQALRSSRLLQSGSVRIDGQAIILRGYRADDATWQAAMKRLNATLLDGMQQRDETLAQPASLDFAELCQRQFDAALRGRRVMFQFDSTALRSAAFPLLDAIVEIAADCADAQITISGHTDATGNAESNQKLSQRRALAVLDYLTAHGIEPARLRALGAGASRPLDTGGTAAARARNRRIEFAFEFPASD